MKDAYTKLMLQQHTSNDAAFYEKLENAQKQKNTVRVGKQQWLLPAFAC